MRPRKSQMQDYIQHLEAEVERLRALLDESREIMAESQGMYQRFVLPTLTRAQEANREYVRHLRHCPDPTAGSPE